jgi:hypothetical protein
MAQVSYLSSTMVVGNTKGHHFNAKTLKDWAGNLWTGHLGYVSTVKILGRGWFAFKFARAEDALWVLKSPWSIDSTPILFKLWTPLFDAGKEWLDIVPIWVRLPCLPLELWSKEIFKMIGNTLGNFS